MAEDFLIGGISAVASIVLVNPFDVAKTRMQLQGEGTARSAAHTHKYRNVWHCITRTAAEEGLRGVQRGLVPAALFQFGFKSGHFGFYALLKDTLGLELGVGGAVGAQNLALATFAASGASALSAAFTSPFWMIKTRMQAQSSASSPVGYQHRYKNFTDAWSTIYAQGGTRALWQNAHANVIRLSVSGGVQLACYDEVKARLLRYGARDGPSTHFSASLITGALVVAVVCSFVT